MIRGGTAYRCFCTKEELDQQRAALKAVDPKASFRYPGTCRTRKDQPDRPFVVRFKTPEGGAVTYVDKVFGGVTTPNSAQQDFVLLRSDGVPLYNFGAVVDDFTMGITLVARGRDHMVNTPPQILLYQALGAKVPEFAHLPMMLAPNGEKLSKRHGAVSVSEYRAQGYAPEAVLNYLARFGWSHGDQEVFSMQELVGAFGWEACGRGDGKFDAKKFLAIQHEHMKRPELQTEATYEARVRPFLEARGLGDVDGATLAKAIPAVRERARTYVEAADALDPYFRDPPAMDAKASEKFLVKANAEPLRALAAAVDPVEPWTEKAIEEAVNAWLAATGLAIKDVAQPARVALTGRTASPGLFQVMEVLGKQRTRARLAKAADSAEAR
jgi:glutamyl-tRNA synthetase